MRLFEIARPKTLMEGGNVFKTQDKTPLTQRIATADVEATVKFLEKITGLDFTRELDPEDQKPVKWLGTTGRKVHADGTFERNSSGDLDLSVDLSAVSKEEVIDKLMAWCRSKKIPEADILNKGTKKTDGWIKDAGDTVHFRTPILGDPKRGYAQTDFMFHVNPRFQQGSLRGGLADSPYRGEHRHILLSSIARARGLKYSPKFGLVDPDTNEPQAGGDDWDRIAQTLLGRGATARDTRSMESILKFIQPQPNYEDLVSQARETLGRQGVELP